MESWSVKVWYKMSRAQKYQHVPPLLTCLFDTKFQNRFIKSEDVAVIKKAVGRSGTYPSRTINGNEGVNCYDGLKDGSSQCHATPSEGPGMKGLYKYYRQDIDPKYYPHYMKIINDLARTTSWTTAHFYKHLAKLFPGASSRHSLMWLGRFAILTIQFASTEHTDKKDFVKSLFDIFLRQFDELLQDEKLGGLTRDELVSARTFVEEFGVSVPTTCGYQFVPRDTNMSYKECGVEVCLLFIMGGIGMCARIHNFWTQIFMSHLCLHNTSVAIFIYKGRAYIGDCPYIDVLAWGKGPPAGS